MFYKLNVLKRMMKEAYKGRGLHVGLTDSGWLTIYTGYWCLCQDFKAVPKELKGYIMELTGEIPKEGVCYRALKDEANQYEMPHERCILPAAYENIDKGMEGIVTEIVLQSPVRNYRIAVIGDFMVCLKYEQADVPAPDLIKKEEGETEVYGPYLEDGSGVIWHNDDTWYLAIPVLKEHLAKIEENTWIMYKRIAEGLKKKTI